MQEYEFPEVLIRLKQGRILYSKERISDCNDAAKLLGKELIKIDRELFICINMSGNNTPINWHVCGMGSTSKCLASIQNIFKSAILSNAVRICILHNHPSGDPNISKGDLLVTKRIAEAGQILDIPLLDSIIVAGEHVKSIRESHPEIFMTEEQYIT